MTCIEPHLARLAPAIERQLKPVLFLAGGYLPQVWVFQTEQETASIVVERSGKVHAVQGPAPHPDVTIGIQHAQLEIALRTRDPNQVPRDPPADIQFHTDKGKMAFNFLKGRFGL